MSDIFISYSRKDSAHAEQLAELLVSVGLTCWIDRHGIEAATSWSGEITKAITECMAFVVMLSPNSIASSNVRKEVSLASERQKTILPLDLEPVELPDDLAYHLAGIQRAPMTNIDAVIRALEKLGVMQAGSTAPRVGQRFQSATDDRKSLMILPFEDLSPTADNQWFADGIVSEMISALSNVKALRIADNQATKEFRNYHGQLTTYAHTMNIRYFVQGDVRKFGDQIKISSRLLDIETGDHLWQDSMKGTMNDIFDIQEAVALKVVEGLKVHLASDEKKKLDEHGTENAEAYELYMKANEYFARNTKEGFQLAVQLFTEAIKLDPSYAPAYQYKAYALAALYRGYDRTPALLDEAETLCKEALRIKPDLFSVYQPLSQIYIHRGQLAEAEEAAREYIRKDHQNSFSYATLGFFYGGTGQYVEAIAPYEEAVRLKPDNLVHIWNLVSMCDGAGEREKCAHWTELALPQYERHLKLHPDDDHRRVHYAILLFMSGRTKEAHAAAIQLTNLNGAANLRDGVSLFNTACLFGRLGDPSEALRTFRKAIEAGFRDINSLKKFLINEKDSVLALQGTPEYAEVRKIVEKLSEREPGLR
jgi:TolB-like protein/Flp pilus assembly protein TadD